MKSEYSIPLEAGAGSSDVVAILSMNGRVHLSQLSQIAALRRPVFINNPLAVTGRGAAALAAIAEENHLRWFSCSALRFAAGRAPSVQNADVECPLWFEAGNATWFWYGIHGVELMLTLLGPGIKNPRVEAANHSRVCGGSKISL